MESGLLITALMLSFLTSLINLVLSLFGSSGDAGVREIERCISLSGSGEAGGSSMGVGEAGVSATGDMGVSVTPGAVFDALRVVGAGGGDSGVSKSGVGDSGDSSRSS